MLYNPHDVPSLGLFKDYLWFTVLLKEGLHIEFKALIGDDPTIESLFSTEYDLTFPMKYTARDTLFS